MEENIAKLQLLHVVMAYIMMRISILQGLRNTSLDYPERRLEFMQVNGLAVLHYGVRTVFQK